MPPHALPALVWLALTIAHILAVLIGLLLMVAITVYADRKIFAAAQLRKGPNVVGPFGLLQSFADLGKFLLKELTIPAGADRRLFILAPLLSMAIALIAWSVMPLAPGWAITDLNLGLLYLLGLSSVGVYGIMLSGWASNSKYAFLGALRSVAQMISYEVSIGLVLVTVILLAGTMNLTRIVELQAGGFWRWNLFGGGHGWALTVVMAPMAVIFFISGLAETNRPPFDLPEAESELVAGYAVEYGSSLYMMFYLAETANIILLSALAAALFLGGWQAPIPIPASGSWPGWLLSLTGLGWLAAKSAAVFFMNAMVRAITPRYRYDQLMRLGWKVFLPASLAAVVVVSGYRIFLE